MRPPVFVLRRCRAPSATPGRVRLILGAAALLAAGLVGAVPGRAADGVFHRSIEVRVGETKQLGVWGGHRSDCTTSIPPKAVQVEQAPRLGTLSQRRDVPFVAQNSVSGTCEGVRFFGTAVDYTARAPGSDRVALEPVFDNGAVHWIYAITILP